MMKLSSILTMGLILTTTSVFGFAADADATDETRPQVPLALAEVDGLKITLADYGKKHPGGLFQAYQTFYTSERKVVEDFVAESLLDREAKKEGLTVDQLL